MNTTNEISNGEDIIDSRDVIARIEYLESERQSLADAMDESREDDQSPDGHFSEAFNTAHLALAEWEQGEEGEELAALRTLAEEAEGYCSDWKYGEALIRDSYFQDYAQQLAEDIGAIDANAKWPNDCIDWERAARELQMDYTAVDFGGVTYWTR